MSIKYDIVYPKKNQLTLLCNNSIIANSKSKSYLVNKMKLHQDEIFSLGIKQEFIYEIVDMNNNLVLNTYNYSGEKKGNGKRSSTTKKTINFIEIDPIRPMNFSRCYAIADDNGIVITDLNLLAELYDFRLHHTFPCEITNKTLAYFATYFPTSKDEFIKCYGVGERVYIKCGEDILKFISEYIIRNK